MELSTVKKGMVISTVFCLIFLSWLYLARYSGPFDFIHGFWMIYFLVLFWIIGGIIALFIRGSFETFVKGEQKLRKKEESRLSDHFKPNFYAFSISYLAIGLVITLFNLKSPEFTSPTAISIYRFVVFKLYFIHGFVVPYVFGMIIKVFLISVRKVMALKREIRY